MKTVRLAEVLSIEKGRKITPSERPTSIRYIQIEDLRGDVNMKWAEEDQQIVACDENDVLLAWDGANAGEFGYGLKGAVGSTLAKLSPRNGTTHTPYLGYFLKSKSPYLRSKCTGATIPHVNRRVLEDIEIPLPPLTTQRRIAAVLDKAQALVANDRQTLSLYDQLAKSLFLEMFGDPVRNERGWTYRNLSTYTDRIVVGHVGPTSHGYAEEGVPYLRTLNVRVNEVDLSDLNHITETFHGKLRKSVIHEGDVLISRVGVNRGMAAPVPKELEGANCGNIIVVARSSKLHPLFLSHYLNMTFGKGSSFGYSVGSAQGVVNTANVKKWPIIDVPPAEQELFARKMKDVHTQRAQAEQSLRQSEGLFGSLLQSAFAGGLG